jgi:hypothetical protein
VFASHGSPPLAGRVQFTSTPDPSFKPLDRRRVIPDHPPVEAQNGIRRFRLHPGCRSTGRKVKAFSKLGACPIRTRCGHASLHRPGPNGVPVAARCLRRRRVPIAVSGNDRTLLTSLFIGPLLVVRAQPVRLTRGLGPLPARRIGARALPQLMRLGPARRVGVQTLPHSSPASSTTQIGARPVSHASDISS